MKARRYAVPKRCNAPAIAYHVRGGYRECAECFALRGDIDGPAQGWFEIDPREGLHCDRPLDGLGARRVERP